MFRLSDRIATVNKPRLMSPPKQSKLAAKSLPKSEPATVEVFPAEETQMPVVAAPSNLPLLQGAPQAVSTPEATMGLVGLKDGPLAALVSAPLLLLLGVGRKKKIEEADAAAAEAKAEAERLAMSAQRLEALAVESKSKAVKAKANAENAEAKAAAAKTWRIGKQARLEVEDAVRAAAEADKAAAAEAAAVEVLSAALAEEEQEAAMAIVAAAEAAEATATAAAAAMVEAEAKAAVAAESVESQVVSLATSAVANAKATVIQKAPAAGATLETTAAAIEDPKRPTETPFAVWLEAVRQKAWRDALRESWRAKRSELQASFRTRAGLMRGPAAALGKTALLVALFCALAHMTIMALLSVGMIGLPSPPLSPTSPMLPPLKQRPALAPGPLAPLGKSLVRI